MAPPSIDALCQQARQAISERNWQKAREAYVQALALKSDTPDIHQGLATVCFQLRDLPAAAHHFKEVTRLDPKRAGAHINLGAIYNLLDQLDEAVTVLRKGIALEPGRSEGYYNLGLVYRRKGQTDLAIHAYREALRINPRLADAQYNLGNVYLEKEMYAQAVECYQHALQIRVGWEKALHGLEAAREALAEQQEEQHQEEAESASVAAAKADAKKLDPTRLLDPEEHGVVLTALHKSTVEAEETAKTFHELTQGELEQAIQELSTALISPDVSITTLDQCIGRFEEAMRSVRALKDELHVLIQKVRLHGDELVAGTSDQ
jgi:tetratricopeptide (TPR) repeat protein